MTIPAHRAAAVTPTSAHSFTHRDGALVNRADEAAAPAATSNESAATRPAPTGGDTTAPPEPSFPAATATSSPTTKGRKPTGEAPGAPTAD